ncbi:ABC transporter permease subunit [Micromonospora auratinigra]|uniref:ABC-2 family transporter protein n=1 Tax=Micromonospora auratinigra TaxID=261654 RepID=A0A1A8Z7Q6_9ACTN|nr:ABC transporter permease subunit [Micromonospora auratinigra]SBT39818.1 ABC-2 family transporter protein [Micromonospora auratinigra]
MIRLTWRQFRVPALAGLAGLVLLGAYLVYLGVAIRRDEQSYLSRCRTGGDCAGALAQFLGGYQNTLLYLAGLLALVPAVLGMFWGAPLVARELETGTHRLVWNQSVTRTRWFAVKLLVVGSAAVTVTGLASLLLTWAASPVDRLAGDRFGTIVFGARNVVPLGYAAFGFVLGTVTGALVRRTLPAMALTAVAFTLVQLLVPNVLRPHLMPPVTVTRPMTAEAINEARALGSLTGAPVVKGLSVPDAWVSEVSELRTRDGRPLSGEAFDRCFRDPPRTGATGTFGDAAACLGRLDLHVRLSFQPNRRYWAFQWRELAIYLALTGLLAGVGRWWIRRRVT